MKKILMAMILFVTILFIANQAVAKLYKWVDQDGVIHYSDAPSDSGKHAETIKTPKYPKSSTLLPLKKTKINSAPLPKKEVYKKAPNKRKQKRKSTDTVEIYTTSWCRYCKDAIAFLKSNHIKYKQFDIEKDSKADAKMRAAGGPGGVPFAIINGKKVYGFSANRYKQVLGLR